jgi:hypothetical protein
MSILTSHARLPETFTLIHRPFCKTMPMPASKGVGTDNDFVIWSGEGDPAAYCDTETDSGPDNARIFAMPADPYRNSGIRFKNAMALVSKRMRRRLLRMRIQHD